MKTNFFIVYLFISVVNAGRYHEVSKGFEIDEKVRIVGLRDEDKEIIHRPCKLEDWDCIRKFLAQNSGCSIKYGPAPDPLILKKDTVNLPFVNVSVVLENVQTSGLNNAKVKEFYVNKHTGNVVFAIDVYGLSERATDTSIIYRRTAKEPIVKKDYTTVTYDLITFTAVIPKVPRLKLSEADFHADIANGNPPYAVGEKAYKSTDPTVLRAFTELTEGLAMSLREAFVVKAKYLTDIFIQDNFCDFGTTVLENN